MVHYVSKIIKFPLFGSHTYFTVVLVRAITIEGSRKLIYRCQCSTCNGMQMEALLCYPVSSLPSSKRQSLHCISVRVDGDGS